MLKFRVVVTTYVFTIAEAKKEKRKRRIKTSTVTRIAASLGGIVYIHQSADQRGGYHYQAPAQS